MSQDPSNTHLSAEQLQALLEGELPRAARSRAEEHLEECSRCAADLDGWKLLFEDLGSLSSHRPHEGFATRVMAAVDIPEPLSLAARVRARLGRPSETSLNDHVAAEVLQDFLDGDLAARRAERIERHLAACVTCTAEADRWIALMQRLSTLDRFAPSAGFADRVLAAIDLPETAPLAARIRHRFAAFVRPTVPEHVPPGILQDLVDGLLPEKAMARAQSHLAACSTCAGEADAWRTVVGRLDGLERLAPSEGFADRVMLAVSTAPARSAVAIPLHSRVLGVARRLVPQTREAWAALSGAAVTPAVVAGLVVYAVFSHPTLTVGSLMSFLWWKATDFAAAAASGVGGTLLQNAESFGLQSLLQTFAQAPGLVAAGVVVYTVASALALRVLYKNLIANRPGNGRYAHVSIAS